jgi:hypothetical protein
MTRAHMQKGEGSRRLGNQSRAKEATNWAKMGPGRPAQAVPGPSRPPFDLDASRAIYSPQTESHTSIHSSSAAEEQRSLRDTISERRVVLVSRVSLADVGTLHGRPHRSSGARIKIEVGSQCDLLHVIIHDEVFK